MTKGTHRRLLPMLMALSIAGAVLLGACGTAAPIASTQPPEKTIVVTGQGQAYGEPDVANVSLGVSVTDSDVGQAVARANQVMADITSALGGAGIDPKDVQTTNYNVWPQQQIDRTTGEPTGQTTYHVDSSLQVKVRQIDKAGQVIKTALDAGANSVNGLSFGIDDPKPLESQARTAAIDDARQRAGELADSLGVSVGDPVQVSESTSGGIVPRVASAEAAQGLGGGAVPISTGQLSVTVQVNVTFELVP
jgi:uncharacterized protein YggE